MFKTRAWGCPTYMQMRDLQAKVKFAVQSSKRFLRLRFVLVITFWVIRLLCCTNDTWIHWMHLPKFFPYFLTFNVDKQYILSYLWSKWMIFYFMSELYLRPIYILRDRGRQKTNKFIDMRKISKPQIQGVGM